MMAFVFNRRLAIPLWPLAFLALALTAPAAATVSLIAILAITVMAFTIAGLAPSSRAAPSVVPKRRTEEEALDLVRMDDDGGWQVARPPA